MYLKIAKRADLKSSHHKTKKFITVVIISYYRHIGSHYVVLVKLIKCFMSVISHIKKKEGVKSSDFQVFHSIVRVQNLKVDKIQGRVPEAFPKFWSFKGGTFLHGIGGAWCGSWQRRRLTNETQGLLKLTEFPCLPPPSPSHCFPSSTTLVRRI